jgi:FkbM family methyltransferase
MTPEIQWRSKNGHDRWAFEQSGGKRSGFFIDIGATISKNNSTVSLEKYFNWGGILINANADHHAKNCRERPNTKSINAALLDVDGTVQFNFTPLVEFDDEFNLLSYLNTVADPRVRTKWSDSLSKHSTLVNVTAITPETMLVSYNAPNQIDYVALDVEGSEHIILASWPFDKYKVTLISVEFNSPSQRSSIICTLRQHSFVEVKNEYATDNAKMYFKNINNV